MFKLESSDGYWYPIAVEQRDENGKAHKQSFEARFKRLRTSEKMELLEQMKAAQLDDLRLAMGLVMDWRGVSLNGDTETPYSAAVAEDFLDRDNVARAINLAWMESITVGAKAKN